jgi:uncharacterized protein (TIGR00369 family)
MHKKRLNDTELQERLEEILNRRLNLTDSIYGQLGLRYVASSAAEPSVELAFQVRPWAANAAGQLHGGIMATCLDTTMGVLTIAWTGVQKTSTINLQVSFVRPVPMDSVLHLRVWITSAGRNVVHLLGEAWTDEARGKIAATASASFFRIADPHPVENLDLQKG